MTTDNTSAHLDGVCDKCFGWVGESVAAYIRGLPLPGGES